MRLRSKQEGPRKVCAFLYSSGDLLLLCSSEHLTPNPSGDKEADV